MIGNQLGGRYEILERIGGGGMALVYKGHDILLHRKVAVKVLRGQYVHDEEFISRFRREAQAAASLSHPNVVSIYDVGQEGEVHYIVMEYIEGTTLNELIKQRAPLPVEEAVHIAAQICDALDHAHHNQIVHRDIKPHNILIGKNGRTKVTDFGIARASTSSTITQTGAVVGSVHYFSPEHAKGVTAGAKSDLYSLGIVMYQMLTGTLPFLGESPISVALKHLQEDVQDPRKINSFIPQSVENIILKAMRKNPDERYQTAGDMQNDLETCLLPSRKNEPKIVFYDDDEMDEERTRVIPAIKPGFQEDLMETKQHFGMKEAVVSSQSPSPTAPSNNGTTEPPGKKPSAWKRPLIWMLILFFLASVMGGLVWYMLKKIEVPELMVPTVEQMDVERAKKELTDKNLQYDIIEVFDKAAPKGIVVKQDPKDQKVKEGYTIKLNVSKGSEKQKMASVIGEKASDVQLRLEAQGLKKEQITIEEVFSTDQPAGIIIRQFPAANEEYDPAGIVIKLTVSKGKETFKMPSLKGLTQKQATDKLKELGLKLRADALAAEPSYEVPKGSVIQQFPFNPGDDVSPGDEITTLVISAGLPDEAGQMIVAVPVKLSAAGKSTNIKIIVTDARYKDFEYRSTTINKDDTIDVSIVVAPDKNAVIQVKQDDKVVDVITKSYQDYLASKRPGTSTPKPSPTPTPGGPSTPTSGTGTGASPTPSAKPVNGTTGGQKPNNGG